MRKLFAFFLVAVLYSCNVSDDGTNFTFVKLAVEPEKITGPATVNIPFEIPLTYSRPSDCHFTEGFVMLNENLEDNIFVFTLTATIIEGDDCEDLVLEKTQISLPFVAKKAGNYTFLFWQGKDENNLDEFTSIEVTIN